MDTDVDAAGNDEQRANERDETDIFVGGLTQTVRIMHNKKITACGEGAEAKCDLGIMQQPPARRKNWRDRHRAEQQHERQHQYKFSQCHRAELCGRSGGGQTQMCARLSRPLDVTTIRCDCFRACRRIHQQRRRAICSLTSQRFPLRRPSLGAWKLAERRLFPALLSRRNLFSLPCCRDFSPNAPSLSSRKI